MKMEELLAKQRKPVVKQKRERPWLAQEDSFDKRSDLQPTTTPETTPNIRQDITPDTASFKQDKIPGVISDIESKKVLRPDATPDTTHDMRQDTTPDTAPIKQGKISGKVSESIEDKPVTLPDTTPDILIRSLPDSCRKLLSILLSLSHNSDTTPVIKHRVLTEITGIKEPTIKKALQILARHALIEKVGSKSGRQGGYQVKLNKEVKKYYDTISDTTPNKMSACSSLFTRANSIEEKNTTSPTTTALDIEDLKQQKQKIDECLRHITFTPEARKYIGDDNVRELLRKGLTPVWIQTALDIFTAVISDPDHRMQSPAAVFMSRAREGTFLNPPRGYLRDKALLQVAEKNLDVIGNLVAEEIEKEVWKQTAVESKPEKSLDDIPF